jgi:tetratricopeptide (TPR) repeat protein
MTNKLQLTVLFFAFSLSALAQKVDKNLEKADAYYAEYKYAEAIKLYKPIADDTVKENRNVIRKLAECYRKINDYKNAENYLSRVVNFPNISTKYFLYYGQTLYTNGKTKEALQWIDKYLISNPEDVVAKDLWMTLKNVDTPSSSNSVKNPKLSTANSDYKPKPVLNYNFFAVPNVNTQASEYGAIATQEGLMYCSTMLDRLLQKTDKSTNAGFLNIYQVQTKADSNGVLQYSSPERLKGVVNGMSFNTGTACLSLDEETLYYTKNNYSAGESSTNKKDEVVLKIFSAKRNGDAGWTSEHELEFNSMGFSCAYPTVSQDGNSLYFTSNRGGGLGGVDIFVSKLQPNGKWGKVENLGKVVNTLGNERFPFIHADGSLYFSSDGHPNSLGGMDIYRAIPDSNGKFMKLEHLNAPFNSSADDFSFYIEALDTRGFLSSNRDGGKGSDDIYGFDVPTCSVVISLQNDTITDLPKSDIRITPLYASQPKFLMFKANNSTVNVLPNTEYVIYTDNKDYERNEKKFVSPKAGTQLEITYACVKKNIVVNPAANTSKP